MVFRLLIGAFLVQLSMAFCPSGCECDDTGLTVRCLGGGITVVPILLNPGLKKLNLAYNRISGIDQAFDFYEWLETLDLSHNKIRSIGQNNFQQQLALRELRLGHNNISLLGAQSLVGLKSLQILDLSYNKLRDIPTTLLSVCTRLRILILANNKLVSISPKVFKGINSLKSLDLCDNYLRRVPGAALEYVGRTLESLELCCNRILGVQPDDFPTPSLKSVSMEGNRISFVDSTAFNQATRIQKLSLENNQLNKVPTGALVFLPNLLSLNLNRNNFSQILGRDLRGLFTLNSLEISGCPNLHYMESSAFYNTPQLTKLTLSFNPRLSHIDQSLLSGLSSLQSLDLRSNNLKSVFQSALPKTSLASLDLRGNPFTCNCSILWLKSFLLSRNSSVEVPDVLCAEPDQLRGQYISGIPEHNLSCVNKIQMIVAVASGSLFIFMVVCICIMVCRGTKLCIGWQQSKHMKL